MCVYYTTLSGKQINLDTLIPKHINILKKFFGLYSQNCDSRIFFNEVNSSENTGAMGGVFARGKYWRDATFVNLAISNILDDMSAVLCIRGGLYAKTDTSYMEANEKILRKFFQKLDGASKS